MTGSLLLLTLLALVCERGLSQQEYVNGECYVEGVPTRCEPVRMSFSLFQPATASSTCGAPPTRFCTRSVSLGRVLSDCSGGLVCDGSDPDNDHEASYLTDFPLNEMSWWQSENSLVTADPVVIDIPLLTLAEISFVSFDFYTIKAAAFHLERSTNYGVTYRPYHYFAVSCEDQFGILPEVELTTHNETIVLCQEIPEPPSPGIITFFPAIDRPSANDSTPGYSEALYQFSTATNIRVVLDQHYEVDLAGDDHGYYYALEDINVIGSCQCYGHASRCVENSVTGMYECVCKHNTTGTHCERCLDFYNDVPWQRADGSGPFECKICNCNNHSQECVFDEAVYSETGQTSGGVCVNCDGNTDGQQCETCAPYYYPRPDREQTDADVCEACQCSLEGVVDSGDCVKEGDGTTQPGDCYCKTNVMGRQCDMCVPGYFNLSAANPDGCQVCSCSVNGSATQMCNHITGECECKPNVVGSQCDSCRENHYQPDPNEGCWPCDCNPGGSTSPQCDMMTGQCDCLPGITGLKCNQVIPGRFFPAIDHLRLEGESAVSIPPSVVTLASGEGETFTGTGHYRVVEGEGISVFGTLEFPQSGLYEILFRYNLVGTLVWDSVTVTIRAGPEEGAGVADCENELPVGDTSIEYTSWTMGTGLFRSQTLCFRAGRLYTSILSEAHSGQTSSPTLDIDSLVAIPVEVPGVAVFGDSQLVADYRGCVDSWRRVSTISSAEPTCELVTFTFSTAIYSGAQVCDCDPDGSLVGTVCKAFGGQCVCLPGVRGRQCDECRPGTYDLSPSGCTACSCDPVGSVSELCDPELGRCECLPNVAGPNCSTCEPNFWGLTDDRGCTPCSCNEIGSSSLQCDEVTGECQCKPGVIGSQCDSCDDGYYGFSTDGCSQCSCSLSGAVGQDCDTVTGQCTCKENARTRDCSACVPGNFNLQESNPSGCQPCYCSGLGVTCSPAPGYTAANISTDFSSGLQGWAVVTETFVPHPDPDSVIATDIPFSSGLTVLPDSSAFLRAPQNYLGNILSSYLQSITIHLELQSSSSLAVTTTPFDVVISGNNLELGARFPTDISPSVETLTVLLHESFGWFHTSSSGLATAGELQTVLSTLGSLYITAGFNSSIILSSISLDTVQESASDSEEVTWVEQCDCPTGFSGLSCEVCSPGYTRSLSGSCEPCECNGFSETCDPVTGVCVSCSGSTGGASCSECLPGTYGDPTEGVPCLPCPCPLTTTPGQFTDSCILQHPDTVVCLNCPVGHTGSRCESCSAGFFGDPTGENGFPTGCSDCLCNGNIDSDLPNSCNTTTGICLQCINNTAGDMCERCADGFYGDAIIAKNCTACDCDPTGSTDSSCDHQTGTCSCLPNVAGPRCEECSPGYYGFNNGAGCTPCACNLEGSVDGLCNPQIGQCSCKSGVTGLLCDQCDTGFFDFSPDGCQACNCSTTNSVTTCDSSGVCQCQPGSTGTNCDTCINNYYQDSEGCAECPQCYQELEERADSTSAEHDRVESSLFNLLIEASPYDPRLNDLRDDVRDIASLGQMYSQRHDKLQEQVVYLTTAVNETLRRDIIQLDASLQLLKTISTPVFIQALAAEELMNRTITEFQMARDEIAKLVEFYIPNITLSLSAINDSHTVTSEALERLRHQVQLLSMQAYQIHHLVAELLSSTNTSLLAVDDIQSLHEQTQDLASVLQQNLSEYSVNTLTQRVRIISLEIMQVYAAIREQMGALPTIPSPDTIEELTVNLTSSKNITESLNQQVVAKEGELSDLQEIVAGREEEVDSLLETLSEFYNQTTTLEDRVQTIGNLTRDTANNVEQKISLAEEVLENLRNISNDTFEVGRRASLALGSVGELTTETNAVLNSVAAIQQNVSELFNTVQEASQNTQNAGNITQSALTEISDLDTDALVSRISYSQNASQKSLEEAVQLQMEAEHYQERLHSLREETDRAEEVVQNTSALVAESEELLRDSNSSVEALKAALSSLDSLESTELQQTLQELSSQLSLLESELNLTDIQTLYSMLDESLQEQRAARQELESSLAAIEGEIQHLRHLESMLPLGCDSNL